jgi:ketosteroid isomerase-like protein
MLRCLIFIAGTVALVLSSATAVRADDAAVAAVKQAEQRISQAFANKDVTTIKQMITPDHIAITPYYHQGLNADQMIAALDDAKITKVTIEESEVRPLDGNVALVTEIRSYQGTYKDSPYPARVYVSAIWVKRDGAWRTTFYQETALPTK